MELAVPKHRRKLSDALFAGLCSQISCTPDAMHVGFSALNRVMRADRSIFGRWIFCLMVCVLLGGIVSAELPELLSLTDNTSNDFTIRKASGPESTSTLSAAIHKSVPLDTKNFA